MVYSDNRKQILSGWLQEKSAICFNSSLKLQKFLFFYESFSKVENDTYDFNKLKGYENGPVFSSVFGDYRHDEAGFRIATQEAFNKNPEQVNEVRANLSSFIVKIMTERELSLFTHKFNMWNSKKKEIIENKIKDVGLDESDFNENDISLLNTLKTAYSDEYIDSVSVFSIDDKSFVITKKDAEKLSKLPKESKDSLFVIAKDKSLFNPIYISLDSDGVIIVD
jgi:hypothetical protein